MFAITALLLVLAISLLITRVATVILTARILTASGMSREAARFQARSAFTGAGFTTGESEHVVNHPLRRRVVATLKASLCSHSAASTAATCGGGTSRAPGTHPARQRRRTS